MHADYHDPQRIITEAARTLDFDRPVAVMFMGVMGARRLAESGGVPYILTSCAARPSRASVFAGLEFVEPGLVEIGRRNTASAPQAARKDHRRRSRRRDRRT